MTDDEIQAGIDETIRHRYDSLDEVERLEAERDRYRAALEHLADHPVHLGTAGMAEYARKALGG